MKTYELQIQNKFTEKLLLLLNTFPKDAVNIYEIKKHKLPAFFDDEHIEAVSLAEQKEIEKEIEDPDCNIIASSKTVII